MKLSRLPSVHRGFISEGVIMALLPNHPFHCAKQKARSYFYDIEWYGIKIEVKGSLYKNGYTFSMPKRQPHVVWHNQETSLVAVVDPNIYTFVGWNGDDINIWVIPFDLLKDKTALHISDKSHWNKYKLKDLVNLPLEVCRRSRRRFDWMQNRPYETKSR